MSDKNKEFNILDPRAQDELMEELAPYIQRQLNIPADDAREIAADLIVAETEDELRRRGLISE